MTTPTVDRRHDVVTVGRAALDMALDLLADNNGPWQTLTLPNGDFLGWSFDFSKEPVERGSVIVDNSGLRLTVTRGTRSASAWFGVKRMREITEERLEQIVMELVMSHLLLEPSAEKDEAEDVAVSFRVRSYQRVVGLSEHWVWLGVAFAAGVVIGWRLF